MTLFIVRRLLQSIFVLLTVSLAVFFAIYAIGDPIELLVSPEASVAERQLAIQRLGLDKPAWTQYLTFMGNALHGDLGTSFVHGIPAIELIIQRIPATLELVILSLFIALLVGLPLGLLAGLNPDNRASRVIMTGSIFGYSLPSFWQGMMLILLFSVFLGWLPTSGRGQTAALFGVPFSFLTWDGLRHMILPALNLAVANAALVIRLTASGTAEARMQDYVKYARAKGVRPRRIVSRHILRNILIPVVTVMGLEFGNLIAFSTVTETVFSWPGMGKLLIDSVYHLDRPVVVAYVLVATLMFVIINLIVDLAYAALDPRVQILEQAQ